MSARRPVERDFGLIVWIVVPIFLLLVLFGRITGTKEASHASWLQEATEWARSTLAVSLHDQ